MKALIRGKEVMTEPFTPWVQANMDFLTGKEVDADGNPVKGDGWELVEDYEPPSEPSAEPDDGEYVTVNGKRILKSDLAKLLG